MTVSQLHTIFFDSPNNAYTTVRRLRKAGLLKVYKEEKISSAEPMILYLSNAGKALITRELDLLDHEIFAVPFKVLRSDVSRQNFLSVNNFRSLLLRADRDHADYQVHEWFSENTFRKKPDYVVIKNKKYPLYPDGVFFLETPDLFTYCYVEIDTGSETLGQFKTQLEVYRAYLATKLHSQRFKKNKFILLVMSSGKKRLAHIIEDAIDVGMTRNILFTTLSELTPETIFTRPIWRRLKGERLDMVSIASLAS